MTNGTRDPKSHELLLTAQEQSAIASLKRLAKRWPKTLLLFGGGGPQLSIRKIPSDGALYDDRWEVDAVNIPNDGGDGGLE